MMKTVYHKMPEQLSPKSLAQLRKLELKKDEDIDYSDIPALDERQLDEVARIVRERKKRMPSITLQLPPQILDEYKQLGKGYTSIMARILCEYIQEHTIL